MSTCENKGRFRYTWPSRDESFVCSAHSIGLMAIAEHLGLHLQMIPVAKSTELCAQQVSGTKCGACDGCGFIADDEDHTPWRYWAELEPPANMAVVAGIVKPVICDACKGNCYG
jgi:hypothetical protein